MRPPKRRGPIRAPLDGLNDRREPVRHIQRGRFARQHVVAQGAQDLGQVTEQDLGGGVLLTFAVAAHQCDEPVGDGDGWIVVGERSFDSFEYFIGFE